MPQRRYNWDLIRQDYVEGIIDDNGDRRYPTLTEAGKRHGAPANRTRERAAKENWTDARATYQAHLEKVRQDKRAAEIAKEARELDTRTLTASKVIVQLITARLGEIGRAQQQRARDGQEADPLIPAIDARELDTLTRALNTAHTIGLRSLGENPTTRTEIVGPDGGPVQSVALNLDVAAELTRDDPDRAAAVIQVLERAGLVLTAETDGEPDEEDPPGS